MMGVLCLLLAGTYLLAVHVVGRVIVWCECGLSARRNRNARSARGNRGSTR